MNRKLINFLVGSIVVSLLLSSCDNFLQGSNLKNQLDEVIKDANAERVNITISALNSYGTLTGEKGGLYKVGESNLSLIFEESDAYQFVKWCVYDTNSLLTECSETDPIYIKDPENPKTVFNVNSSCNNYRIEAICLLRPYITNVLPTYQANGVSRDSAITVTFDRVLSLDNFRYTDDEIVKLGDVTLLKDANGKAYGYKKNGITYFKNINIRSNEGKENLLNFFQAPELNEEILTIAPKKSVNERFALDENGYKDIRVSIENNVCYENLKMKSSKTWNYRVADFTDSQCTVSISTMNNSGSISTSGGNYSVGSQFILKYTESDQWQFVNFIINKGTSDAVSVSDINYDSSTGIATAVVTVQKGDATAEIIVDSVRRPEISSFIPAYNSNGVDFDTSIELTFLEALNISESDKISDFIHITDANGNIIDNYFSTPILDEQKKKISVKFAGSKFFNFGEEKYVGLNVNVSKNLYTIKTSSLGEEVKSYFDKSDKSYNYRVANTSTAKATITFEAKDSNNNATGTLTKAGLHSFNLGETFEIQFTPSKEYEFVSWNVQGALDELLINENGNKLSVTVLKPVSDVSVSPVCRKLGTSRIYFGNNYGTTMPRGEQNYIENEELSLVFFEGDEYMFIKWVVRNQVTDELVNKDEYERYFTIENINTPSTTVTVHLASTIYSIEPDCYKRAVLIQHSPSDTSNPVEPLTPIQLFFDTDVKGIPFTVDEKLLLESEGATFLNAETQSTYYYAYENENGIHYKNVEITDFISGRNLAEHFNFPAYFYDSNTKSYSTKSIIIKPKTENPPPAGTFIKVEIGTKYYSLPAQGLDTKRIYMSPKNLVFVYQIKE